MESTVTSLYIHIPFCISKCSYCDFFSVPCRHEGGTVPDEYVDALCNEILYRFREHNVNELKSIYIGGGTPSLLSENQLGKIFSVINTVKISSNTEITIEMNPDDITESYLEYCSKVGINRISCGIQSLNEESLKFVKRRADAVQNLKALDLLGKYWKKNFSVDLICGLPYESYNTFKKGLKSIIKSRPDHISVYTLVLEDETELGKYYMEKENYDYDFADKIWIRCKKYLKHKGYLQYEVSNFAKKEKQCVHNLVYWNHGNYLGCGSGATGTVYNDDGSGIRITNSKNINLYSDFWNKKDYINLPQETEIVEVNDSKFEFFMMGLRKASGISDREYKNIFHEELSEQVKLLFEKWQMRKLCKVEKSEDSCIYKFTEKGLLYLNKFLEELEI